MRIRSLVVQMLLVWIVRMRVCGLLIGLEMNVVTGLRNRVKGHFLGWSWIIDGLVMGVISREWFTSFEDFRWLLR